MSWIKCSERMPDDGIDVLLWYGEGIANIGNWSGGYWYTRWGYWEDGDPPDVTHWQPLPEPPHE